MKWKYALIVLTLLTCLTSTIVMAQSKPSLSLYIDEKLIPFKTKAYIQSGTTFVPFRKLFEELDYQITWNAKSQTVIGMKGSLQIQLQVNKKTALVHGNTYVLQTPPQILHGTVFVPLRFIGEASGAEVKWNAASSRIDLKTSKTVDRTETKPVSKQFQVQGLSIGNTLTEVKNKLGEPKRIDPSEYGFKWYIYHQNYKNYVQVGISENTVVALYTNATNWNSLKGVKYAMKRTDVEGKLGKPITKLKVGNIQYTLNDGVKIGRYAVEDYYVILFYDEYKQQTVTSLMLVTQSTEQGLKRFTTPTNSEVIASFEKQNFDITNALRVRMGKPSFKWDNSISITARKHSVDMAVRKYFDHKNPDGQNPFDRMEEDGISFRSAGENIAAGQQNAIFAHEAWMNSEGHRKNILSDNERLGVGVALGGEYHVYYTQNFYSSLKK